MSKSGKTIRTLNSAQKWAVGKWLDTHSTDKNLESIGYDNLSEKLTKVLGFDVSPSSVATIAKAMNKHSYFRAHEGRGGKRNNEYDEQIWKCYQLLILGSATALIELHNVIGSLSSVQFTEIINKLSGHKDLLYDILDEMDESEKEYANKLKEPFK